MCNTEKSITEFHKKKDSKDGFRNRCKECRRFLAKEDYKKNKEYHRQYKKNYRKDNQWKLNAIEAKRRCRKRSATPKWLTEQHWRQIQNIYFMASITLDHVDHVIPLQGKNVCGLHVPWNLQILSPKDNLRKSNNLEDNS